MAETHSICAVGVTFAANKSMAAIFNGVGSGRVLRIYRVWQLNNQTAGVTGVLTTMALRRISALAGGTALTAVKHDTNSGNLPAQVLLAAGGTATDSGDPDFMRWMWSNDEPSASALSNDETETMPALGQVMDLTGDSNLEPITLREGEGVHVKHLGSTTVGNTDVIIEFTNSAT
jgi:hypothetical protein